MTAKITASADGTKVLIGTASEDALQIDSVAKTVKALAPYTIEGAGGGASFVAGQSVQTNFPNSTKTKVLFNSAVRNVGNAYDPGESRFTAPRTGMYAFSWAVGQGNDVTTPDKALFGVNLIKNGDTSIPAGTASTIELNNAFRPTCAGCAVVLLNAGDYVEVFGVPLGIPTTPMVSTYLGVFSGQWIGDTLPGGASTPGGNTGSAMSVGLEFPSQCMNATEEVIKFARIFFDLNSDYEMVDLPVTGKTPTGKFKPKVAGYYQANWSVQLVGNMSRRYTVCRRGGSSGALECRGSDMSYTPSKTAEDTSTGSWFVYLNGTDDYLEVCSFVATDAAPVPVVGRQGNISTTFSAHFVRA